MSEILNNLMEIAETRLLNVLLAIGILVVGWLVALIVSIAVRAALKKTSVDDRLAGWLIGEDRRLCRWRQWITFGLCRWS